MEDGLLLRRGPYQMWRSYLYLIVVKTVCGMDTPNKLARLGKQGQGTQYTADEQSLPDAA